VAILDDLGRLLGDAYNNPLAYTSLTFLYAIAVAIVLPFPIEVALVLPLFEKKWALLAGLAIALAAGKTLGAWLIFLLGVNVEGPVRRWSQRWRFAAWFVAKAERFVAKTGNLGLYVLLSIPGMTDTIPLYVYSIFNADGKAIDQRMYLGANFLAALNRVALLVLIFVVIGVNLFGL